MDKRSLNFNRINKCHGRESVEIYIVNVIDLLSPAKVNLYLKIINKRDDGFHDLKTIFERIDLCDRLIFRKNSSGRISVSSNHPDVPLDSSNLVYQVAEKLKADYSVSEGVDIEIEKKIPVAAGLAGGSTNAATTLKALNQLWKLELPVEKLIPYADQLGSDITFFLYDKPWALGIQRGEKITPLDLDQSLWHVLVVPEVKMYTPRVFRAFKMELTKDIDNVNILARSLKAGAIEDIGSYMVNDLQPVVFDLEPSIRTVKEQLEKFEGVCGTMVSGSGPSVYSVVQTEGQAQSIAEQMKKKDKRVFVVKTLV